LLLSTLYPRYVPLIRYRVGDAAIEPQRRDHGHVWRFASVAGRLNDVILMGDGDAVHSESILHCVLHERAVFNVQLELRDDATELRVVTASAGADRSALEARIRGRLGQVHPRLADIRFVYADDLHTTRAGKRRWFVDRRSAR
jgi:phenylacetate-coenzyme A ligase PaaK-like adenylate-forming protein